LQAHRQSPRLISFKSTPEAKGLPSSNLNSGSVFGGQVSFRLFSIENKAQIVGGYGAVHQDYTDSNGDGKFEWNVTLLGPILGLVVKF
jgi:hypothetical protein